MTPVIFRDLGLIDYKAAWDLQEKLHAEIVAAKLAHRIADTEKSVAALPGQFPDSSQSPAPYSSLPTHYSLLPTNHYLLFCEHPHVYTLGRSGDEKNLLVDDEALKSL